MTTNYSNQRHLSESLPPARVEVIDMYWKLACARQDVFFARMLSTSPPWTDDEVLQHYKFTNVYRSADRVSQYLIKDVIYDDDNRSKEDVIFRILLFKIFNNIDTWKMLVARLGELSLHSFNVNNYGKALDDIIAESGGVFSGSYIMTGFKMFGFDKKHWNYLELLHVMCVKDRVQNRIRRAGSMEEIYNLLLGYPMIGPFLAYQYSIDMNYSNIIDFDEDEFTQAGVGAIRGIAKLFGIARRDASKVGKEAIMWMVANQESEFERLELNFKTLWGRRMHAIDCQNVFCEFDKYSRVAMPDIDSFGKRRIKRNFVPSKNGAIDYFFPPKWRINDNVRSYMRGIR